MIKAVVMAGGSGDTVTNTDMSSENIMGDTSESKVKTDILNQGDTSKGGDIVIGSIDSSTKLAGLLIIF